MNQLNNKILKLEYKKIKIKIKQRLEEFEKIRKKSTPEELFIELCYCLCTPQSKAEKVNKIINKGNLNILKSYDDKKLAAFLRGNCRFHNNKAKYICLARKYIPELQKISGSNTDTVAAREYLVKNIKGMSFKEASHYLRNTGHKKLAIIDRHIVNTLHELEIFEKKDMPKNPKEYIIMENKIKDFAAKIQIDMDELDLLLWSIKTGYILK